MSRALIFILAELFHKAGVSFQTDKRAPFFFAHNLTTNPDAEITKAVPSVHETVRSQQARPRTNSGSTSPKIITQKAFLSQ